MKYTDYERGAANKKPVSAKPGVDTGNRNLPQDTQRLGEAKDNKVVLLLDKARDIYATEAVCN